MTGFDAAKFQALRAGNLGKDLKTHARLASTQDEARQEVAAGAAEGCVVLAEVQEAGRGRWGRRWEGRPEQSLLFTAVLDRASGAADPATLPILLGLASVQALRDLGLADAGLKWPNDLVWRDRKLGGLLVEQSGAFALAGCGLNIGQAEADFPDELRPSAASLRQAGLELGREAVLAALLGSWERHLALWRGAGLEPLLPQLDDCDALKGRVCRVRFKGELLEGSCAGIAADGALKLLRGQTEDRLRSAEVEQVRPAGAD